MRTEHVIFVLLSFATACSLLASPGDYGSEYTDAPSEGARDASSEDGG